MGVGAASATTDDGAAAEATAPGMGGDDAGKGWDVIEAATDGSVMMVGTFEEEGDGVGEIDGWGPVPL